MGNIYADMENEQTIPASSTTPTPSRSTRNIYEAMDDEKYDPRVNPNALNLIKPTTPKEHVKSLWDVPGAAYHHIANSLGQFYKSIVDTYNHPSDTYNALMKAPGGVPDLNAIVPGARDEMLNAAGGVALGALDPQAQAALIAAHPELQKAADKGTAMSKYARDNYGDQQAWRDSLGLRPFQTAADLSTALTAPVMGAGLVGLGAKGLGLLAARLGSTAMGDAAATGLRGAEAVSSAMQLPAKIGDAVNPINFVPDAPGNLIIGAGKLAGLGSERIGNFLVDGGRAIKPTRWLSDASDIAGRAAMKPENRMFLDAAGGEAPNVQAALTAAVHGAPGATPLAGPIVPNSPITGPQAVANLVNAPRLQVLGKEALRNQPEAANAMLQQAAAARTANIENVFDSSPGSRAAAQAKTEADRARDYPISDARISKGDNSLMPIWQTPEMQKVLKQVKENYANDRIPVSLDYVPAHSVPTGVLDAKGNMIMKTVPAQYPELPGHVVDAIKKQMDKDAYQIVTDSGGKDDARSVKNVRQDFLNWVNRPANNPMYARSRANFAANKLDEARKDTGAYMQARANDPASFNAAKDDPNSKGRNPTVKEATDSGAYLDQFSDYLIPDHLAALDANTADHARLAEADRQAGLATEYSKALDNAFDHVHSSSIWGMGIKGHLMASIYNNAIKGLNPEVAASLSRSLLTPEGTLELANDALSQQNKIGKRVGAVKAAGNVFRNAFIRNPTIYNILDQQREAMHNAMSQPLNPNQ